LSGVGSISIDGISHLQAAPPLVRGSHGIPLDPCGTEARMEASEASERSPLVPQVHLEASSHAQSQRFLVPDRGPAPPLTTHHPGARKAVAGGGHPGGNGIFRHSGVGGRRGGSAGALHVEQGSTSSNCVHSAVGLVDRRRSGSGRFCATRCLPTARVQTSPAYVRPCESPGLFRNPPSFVPPVGDSEPQTFNGVFRDGKP
jgi:hypothetical protein